MLQPFAQREQTRSALMYQALEALVERLDFFRTAQSAKRRDRAASGHQREEMVEIFGLRAARWRSQHHIWMLFRGNEFTSPAGFTFAVVLAAPSATLPLHVSRKLSGASYVVVVLQGSLKDLLRRN